MPPEQRTGMSSVMPMVEVTLRLSGRIAARFLDAAAGKLRHQATPDQEPNRQGCIETAGHEQHRPFAGKSKGRGFAGRDGDAVRLEVAEPRQRMHRCIAPPAAGAADGNQRRRFPVAERGLVERRRRPGDDAAGFAGGTQYGRQRRTDCRRPRFAAVNDGDARRANRHFADPRRAP